MIEREVAPDDGDTDASAAQEALLGASWGVALQEILLWPMALAAAFVWMLEIGDSPNTPVAAGAGPAVEQSRSAISEHMRMLETGGAFAR